MKITLVDWMHELFAIVVVFSVQKELKIVPHWHSSLVFCPTCEHSMIDCDDDFVEQS